MAKESETNLMKINFGGSPVICMFSHDLVKQLQEYELRGQTKRKLQSNIMRLARKFTQESGQRHSNWRKRAAKGFKPSVIEHYVPFIQSSAQNILLEGIYKASKESNESIYFCNEAKKFAFDIGITFVFGPLLNEHERNELFQIFQVYANGFGMGALEDIDGKIPGSVMSNALIAQQELSDYLMPKYKEAIKLTEWNQWDIKYLNAECLLKSLLENDGLFDYSMADNMEHIVGLAFAAYDTTASSLSNLVYAMHNHPDETEKVRNAILAHPQLSDKNQIFTMDMFKSCNELSCFVNECQRRYGIVPSMIREVHDQNGLEFGDYLIPNETQLLVPIKWLHHGEGSWTESMEFKPSRFDKSNGQSKEERGDIGRYNHIPFATGLHKCLGMHLAQLEMNMYTVLLLRDWEFELDEEKLSEQGQGAFNQVNMANGIPHYNVHLKMKRRI